MNIQVFKNSQMTFDTRNTYNPSYLSSKTSQKIGTVSTTKSQCKTLRNFKKGEKEFNPLVSVSDPKASMINFHEKQGESMALRDKKNNINDRRKTTLIGRHKTFQLYPVQRM